MTSCHRPSDDVWLPRFRGDRWSRAARRRGDYPSGNRHGHVGLQETETLLEVSEIDAPKQEGEVENNDQLEIVDMAEQRNEHTPYYAGLYLELAVCQQKALAHVSEFARAGHERALPDLLARVSRLGFKQKHLHGMLEWVAERAPIIIHFDLDRMIDYLETDTHYRNQFETGTSGGLLNPHTRSIWERDLFGGFYDAAAPFERVKYGVLNVFNDPKGYTRLKNFGDSYLVLCRVRQRCTLTAEDSGQCAGGKRLVACETPAVQRLALPHLYAHVAIEYTDEELCAALRAANTRDIHCGDTSRIVKVRKYKEVQIHGEVRMDSHVERLVANERHWPMQPRLAQLCSKYGWTLGWTDTERGCFEAAAADRISGRSAAGGRWRRHPPAPVDTGCVQKFPQSANSV